MSTTDHQDSLDSVLKQPCNNLVAVSDFRAALKGIENRLEEELAAVEEAEAKAKSEETKNFDEDAETEGEHRVLWRELIQESRKSLIANLERVVRVVPDETYYEYIKYKKQEFHGNDDDNDEDDIGSTEDELSDDDSGSDLSAFKEDEYDEEELLDQEAIQRAQALRQEVRDAAKELQSLRMEKTQQAMELSARSVRVLVGDTSDKPDDESSSVPSFKLDVLVKQLESDNNNKKKKPEKVLQLEAALKEVNRDIQSLLSRIPDASSKLQETLANIDDALEKENAPLSQTERAIRYCDDDADIVIPSHMTKSMAAEDRVFSFLGQYD